MGTARAGALTLAWAFIGVLGGHELTYAVLFPDAHGHDRVLAGSGHGWTSLLGPALLTSIAIVTALCLMSVTSRGRMRHVRFTVLLVLQVGTFTGIEIGERVAASGLTVDTLWHHLIDHGLASILLVGAIIQVVTAWFGSAMSRVVAAVADRARRARARRRGAQPRRAILAACAYIPPSVLVPWSRGPPPWSLPRSR
jgi:hypothetical protein